MRRACWMTSAVLAVSMFAGSAWAGKVTGRVSFDEPAAPLAKDANAAEKQRYRAANKVVIWIDGIRDAEPTEEKAQLLQGGSQFYPPLLITTVGQTVEIINNDNVVHGAYSDSKSNPFDTGLKKKGEVEAVEMKKPGLVRVGCPIHEDMQAKILVVPSSFHAVIDPGKPFVIPDLPAGEYRISAWRDGYGRKAMKITVPEDGAATVDFELAVKKKKSAAAPASESADDEQAKQSDDELVETTLESVASAEE